MTVGEHSFCTAIDLLTEPGIFQDIYRSPISHKGIFGTVEYTGYPDLGIMDFTRFTVFWQDSTTAI